MTTNYKILIGLGVIAAGVGIYMYTRKKNETKSNLVTPNTSCPNGVDEQGRCKGAAVGGKRKTWSNVEGAGTCRCGKNPKTGNCLTCINVTENLTK